VTAASAVQTNLESIPDLRGNITVTGGAGGPFTVTFRNSLAGQNVATIGSSAAGAAVVANAPDGNGFTNVSVDGSAASCRA
jgi:hypothetical protein